MHKKAAKVVGHHMDTNTMLFTYTCVRQLHVHVHLGVKTNPQISTVLGAYSTGNKYPNRERVCGTQIEHETERYGNTKISDEEKPGPIVNIECVPVMYRMGVQELL